MQWLVTLSITFFHESRDQRLTDVAGYHDIADQLTCEKNNRRNRLMVLDCVSDHRNRVLIYAVADDSDRMGVAMFCKRTA